MGNNHYVSRFQTKEYETSANGRKRQLYYYDFKDKKIKSKASKKLFAKDLKAVKDFELKFNSKLETPITTYLNSLGSSKNFILPQDEQAKAFVLFHFLSTARNFPNFTKYISEILEQPAQCLSYYGQEYNFYFYLLNFDLPFFNSHGLFPLIMRNEAGFILPGLCCQYNKRFCTINLDKYEHSDLKEIKFGTLVKNSIHRASIGLEANKIVIDPLVLSSQSQKVIISSIEECRMRNIEIRDLSVKCNEIYLSMLSISGLNYEDLKKHYPSSWSNWLIF